MTDSCALARTRLVDFVESQRKSTLREKTTTAIKAGYVSSIVTPLRAVAGNASWSGFLGLARNPLAAAIDVVQATGKSAATGFKVKPHEMRTYANSLTADGMGAFWRGFGRGSEPVRGAFQAARSADNRPVSTFINELRVRLNARPEIRNTTVEYQRVVYDSPLAQAMTDASFAILEAADRPWWLAAFDSELYRQGRLLGIKEGLTGKALKGRGAALMASPTDEMLLRATDAANYATFKDRNIASMLATDAKTFLKNTAAKGKDPSVRAAAKVGDISAEATVPFVGVPSSIAGKMISTSPFGAVNPDIWLKEVAGTEGRRAKALANTGLGFGMVAIGMKLYDEGRLTFALPRDAAERAQWNEAGKQPYSIKVGDKWYGLKVFGAVASSLVMGGAMRRELEADPENKGAAVGKGVAASAEFLTQQTYLQNIGNWIETVKGGASVGRLAAQMIPAPALLGQASRAADPYEREQTTFAETARGKVGLGFMNPRRMGPTGPLPQRTALERVSSVASPVPIKQSRDTETLAEIRRLNVPFGLPSRTVSVQGKSVKLSRADYEAFVKAVGPRTMRAIEEIMLDPEFQQLDDDVKRDVLSDVVTGIRGEGRGAIKAQLHRPGNPFAGR